MDPRDLIAHEYGLTAEDKQLLTGTSEAHLRMQAAELAQRHLRQLARDLFAPVIEPF